MFSPRSISASGFGPGGPILGGSKSARTPAFGRNFFGQESHRPPPLPPKSDGARTLMWPDISYCTASQANDDKKVVISNARITDSLTIAVQDHSGK